MISKIINKLAIIEIAIFTEKIFGVNSLKSENTP